MYVLVRSNVSGLMYQSVVYGIIDIVRYIVYNRGTKEFELVDGHGEPVRDGSRQHVFQIKSDTNGFVLYRGSRLLKYKRYCKDNGREYKEFNYLHGFPDVVDNAAFICDLLEKRRVKAEDYDIQIRSLPDADKWKYIRTQDDADEFMKLFFGFHDSTVRDISYDSDVIEMEHGVSAYHAPSVTVVFDSEWYGKAELCFEGLQVLRIVPDNMMIYEASLYADESGVYFADDYVEKPDDDFKGSMIRALSLKWRDKQ